MNIILIVLIYSNLQAYPSSLDEFSDSVTDFGEFNDYSDDVDWLFDDDYSLARKDKSKILDDNVENFIKADNSPYFPFDDETYHDDAFEFRSFQS